jgi:hypothetical protein
MLPSDIGAHPDAPNHYFAFGKPKDWAEEDCGTLTIRRVGATGDMLLEPAARLVRNDLPSGESVYPAYLSQWVPSQEEREQLLDKLLAGDPIEFRTLLASDGLPPMSIWLRGADEV